MYLLNILVHSVNVCVHARRAQVYLFLNATDKTLSFLNLKKKKSISLKICKYETSCGSFAF